MNEQANADDAAGPLRVAEDDGGGERDRIVRWRLEQLTNAGYDRYAALTLALDANVDLHLAVALLRRGCSAETALRILC